jgi:phage terminase large subunit GpA-like protein
MKIAGRKPLKGQPIVGETIESLIVEAAAAARPPERLSVAEAAEKYRDINNPGSYVGKWDNGTTPYLIEPMNELQSLHYDGMIFAGPAQCGKTDMALNWIGYSAVCDPADMMVIQTSNVTARDFSMRRIDRLHRHSKKIGVKLVPGKGSDNTFDKHYRSGMLLTLSWPTINELSGKPIPRLWLTDYDRMPEDVDGEGNAFDLARKRATTFRRYAMCAAESSPGYAVDNPKWTRKTRHEAPPTRGILSLFNRGDRRRWYWQCVECSNAFEPSFELLEYPETEDKMEAAEAAVLVCPHCNHKYTHNPDPEKGQLGKHEMNRRGRWVRDGMTWTPDGLMVGTPIRSSIASFWLKGVAAAFSDWKTLVHRYLTAEEEYDATGSEEALKTTVNTDQGEAYTPKSVANDRVPETIKARARDLGIRVVPAPVRFLIATCDVQKNRFVVQVHGIAANQDVYVIDRFEIKKSKRIDEDGEHKWVNPGAYPEDWKLVAEEVLQKSYALADGSGRHMAIKLTVCDSGGKAGVTENAYNFVRWLRGGDDDDKEKTPEGDSLEEGEYNWVPGMAGRFLLLKGASAKAAPRVAISHPDSQRKDRNAGARGEIPVMMINTNTVKDMVNNRLDRTDPGGRFVFPNWLDDNFYIELTVEVKDKAKGWINPRNYRNESWDLLAYCLAATLTPLIPLERMDLIGDPPSWADEWDRNDLVFDPVVSAKPFEEKKKRKTLSELAEDLA